MQEEDLKTIRLITSGGEKEFVQQFFKDKLVYDRLVLNKMSVYHIYHDTEKNPTGVWVRTSTGEAVDVRTDYKNNASLFIKTLIEASQTCGKAFTEEELKFLTLSDLFKTTEDLVRRKYLSGSVSLEAPKEVKEDIYKKLVAEFGLDQMEEADKKEMLLNIAKTIHKQFLLDVYQNIGDEKFKALEASANMGNDFYNTTLKHIVPTYQEIFDKAKSRVTEALKKPAQI